MSVEHKLAVLFMEKYIGVFTSNYVFTTEILKDFFFSFAFKQEAIMLKIFNFRINDFARGYNDDAALGDIVR